MKIKLKVFIFVLATFCICGILVGCTQEVENKDITITIASGGQSDTKENGKFTGMLENNKPIGTGTVIFDDGWTYKGTFVEGALSKGTVSNLKVAIKYNDINYEGKYTGEVNGGKISGSGKFASEGGNSYLNFDGDWKDGVSPLNGKLETDNIILHFKNGNRNGEYKGEIVESLPSGTGTFVAKNSEGREYEYVGAWKNGRYNGEGCTKFTDGDTMVHLGNYEDGEFAPIPAQFYQFLGTNPDAAFNMSDTTKSFVDSNEGLLVKHDKNEEAKAAAIPFDYAAYAKNSQIYDGKVVKIDYMYVINAIESTLFGYDYTYIGLINLDNKKELQDYRIIYLGKLPKLIKGDFITFYGLPLDFKSYTAIDGKTQTPAAFLAGSVIERIEK